uniref:formin-like protein 20 n=1 Tax=Fragaria vesca subsp. vesca TaxID=101020 RepID=UPI0005CB2C4A|nr:PREDICTED: formin-like protein 20 [Fragaria vesca subsp. vesca]
MGPSAGKAPPFSSAPPRPPDPDDLRRRLQIEREERLRVSREETDAFCRNLRQNTAAFKAEMVAFKSEMLTEFRKLLRYSTQSRQPPSSPPLTTADTYPYRCQQHQQPPPPPPTLPAPQQYPHQGAWYSNPQGYCQPPPPPPNPHPPQPQTPSMIINGHPLPHQFPGVSQTHSPPHPQ